MLNAAVITKEVENQGIIIDVGIREETTEAEAHSRRSRSFFCYFRIVRLALVRVNLNCDEDNWRNILCRNKS